MLLPRRSSRLPRPAETMASLLCAGGSRESVPTAGSVSARCSQSTAAARTAGLRPALCAAASIPGRCAASTALNIPSPGHGCGERRVPSGRKPRTSAVARRAASEGVLAINSRLNRIEPDPPRPDAGNGPQYRFSRTLAPFGASANDGDSQHSYSSIWQLEYRSSTSPRFESRGGPGDAHR